MTSLRSLPSVTELLNRSEIADLVRVSGRDVVTGWVREAVDELRASPEQLGDRDSNGHAVAAHVLQRAAGESAGQLGRVINATGVILHTGLGRAPLPPAAIRAIEDLATAGNVEIDLRTGERRYRGHQLQPLWQQLTGCEDSLVVNNNAAATLLTLQALCAGREVVISRGQLIEIGGSFRLPEIFELSGARLREVGTTNRTRLSDYADAITPETAAIMHVHPSNYRVIGFSSTPGIEDLVKVARAHNIPAIDDIGSGSLVDVRRFGLPEEPTFRQSIAAGADVVLGSGDKLLGGPQAGIILGGGTWLQRIRSAAFARTVRVDKLTLAALAATLEIYARGTQLEHIPVLQMLGASVEALRSRAEKVVAGVTPTVAAEVHEGTSPVGGGSLPGVEMPSVSVAMRHPDRGADELVSRLRLGDPRVFPRIQNDQVVLDLRSVRPEDDSDIVVAVQAAAE